MSRMMIQAAVTMGQLQNKLDVIGSNMANSQTTGYKGRQADFSSLLFQQIDNLKDPANAVGRLTPDGVRIGSGSKLGSINLDLEVGAMKETGRELDAALIKNNHFFAIEVENNGVVETQYTRDGAFYLSPVNNDQDLLLTTSDGHPVLGEDGPIVIPNGFQSIQISPEGQVLVERGNLTEVAGRVNVIEAIRPRLLEAVGNNNFRLPDLEALGLNPAEIIDILGGDEAVLTSGSLEQSNVDTSKEMTDLIMAQRSYQSNARTISMGDQMQGLINQIR